MLLRQSYAFMQFVNVSLQHPQKIQCSLCHLVVLSWIRVLYCVTWLLGYTATVTVVAGMVTMRSAVL